MLQQREVTPRLGLPPTKSATNDLLGPVAIRVQAWLLQREVVAHRRNAAGQSGIVMGQRQTNGRLRTAQLVPLVVTSGGIRPQPQLSDLAVIDQLPQGITPPGGVVSSVRLKSNWTGSLSTSCPLSHAASQLSSV